MSPRSSVLPVLARGRRAHAATARGFTLLELMIVVVLVGVLAVMAIPSMSTARIDRRAFADADHIAQMVREARARAIGRGGAVLVTFDVSGGYGVVTTTEAVQPDPSPDGSKANLLPRSSCKSPTDWTSAAMTHAIDSFDFGAPGEDLASKITAKLYVPNGVGSPITATFVAMCFTPLGRSFLTIDQNMSATMFDAQNANTTGFFVEVARRSATNTVIGLSRRVLVPPTGATRIFSSNSALP